MNKWQIGGLILGGLAIIAAGIFGIPRVIEQKQMDDMLRELEPEYERRRRQKEAELMSREAEENKRTATELENKIKEELEALGEKVLTEPMVLDLEFDEDGFLVNKAIRCTA